MHPILLIYPGMILKTWTAPLLPIATKMVSNYLTVFYHINPAFFNRKITRKSNINFQQAPELNQSAQIDGKDQIDVYLLDKNNRLISLLISEWSQIAIPLLLRGLLALEWTYFPRQDPEKVSPQIDSSRWSFL